MIINKEELKHIIDDLIINRDGDIREFNENLYSNVDYTEFHKRQYWYKDADINDSYEYINFWNR